MLLFAAIMNNDQIPIAELPAFLIMSVARLSDAMPQNDLLRGTEDRQPHRLGCGRSIKLSKAEFKAASPIGR